MGNSCCHNVEDGYCKSSDIPPPWLLPGQHKVFLPTKDVCVQTEWNGLEAIDNFKGSDQKYEAVQVTNRFFLFCQKREWLEWNRQGTVGSSGSMMHSLPQACKVANLSFHYWSAALDEILVIEMCGEFSLKISSTELSVTIDRPVDSKYIVEVFTLGQFISLSSTFLKLNGDPNSTASLDRTVKHHSLPAVSHSRWIAEDVESRRTTKHASNLVEFESDKSPRQRLAQPILSYSREQYMRSQINNRQTTYPIIARPRSQRRPAQSGNEGFVL